MATSRWLLGAFALVGVALLVAVFVLISSDPTTPERPGPPGDGPLTVVSMGDSTISGEGAGDYGPDTDGQDGNWCHRSPNAMVNHIELRGATEHVNLACSGAATKHVMLGDEKQWTEPSQAQQLAELVEDHRVSAIVVGIGANDDPQFSRLISQCFTAWFSDEAAPCNEDIQTDWAERVEAVVPKVTQVLTDIRTVLERAGYDEDDYDLVLQSYASPIGPDIPESLRNLDGCPFRKADLEWVRDTGAPDLSEGLHRAASEVDARFLDLSRAAIGHEACTGGDDHDHEWFTRFTVRWDDLEDADRASHAIQESFHPNANGHAQFARCMSEFLASDADSAACLKGDDDNLHAAPAVVAQGER